MVCYALVCFVLLYCVVVFVCLLRFGDGGGAGRFLSSCLDMVQDLSLETNGLSVIFNLNMYCIVYADKLGGRFHTR